ncbi:MAG: hypothetical protein HZB21_06295 [Deltaproteobacteria bacterium]|nr:hypothetical protein [Deltaproteobacteria bacterium]
MSKIYKFHAGGVHAEPFVMKNLEGAAEEEARALYGGKVVGDAGAVERQAYEKGFNAGEKAGFEFGRQKAEVLFQGLGDVLEELFRFKVELYGPCEQEMVDLTLAIAKKVIQREVEIRKEVVLDCVRAGLKALVAAGTVLIRVNPKDLEVIHQYKSEFARYSDGVKGVSIEADDNVSRGGCVIETNYGEVDVTIDGILNEIEERLNDAGE